MKHYDVSCALIINEFNEVFVCKRGPGRPLVGFWEFPGGKKEIDETYEDSIIREIKEELNIVIEPLELITHVYYEYPKIGDFDAFSLNLYAFKCNIKSGKINLNEHTDSKWIDLNDINKLEFAYADKLIVDYILKVK